MYAPWWLYREQLAGKLGFARGYHIEVAGGRRLPGMGTARGLEWLTGGSYGRKFKEDARRYYGSIMNFSGRGDMIPNEDSFCELDPTVKDKWGIPVLRFHWKWSEHEIRQAAHMQQTFADIVAAMGGRLQQAPEKNGAKAIANGGGHHPRGRRRHHGHRPGEVRHQPVVADLGCAQPLSGRRGAVLQQRRQKSHAHHHGAGVARGRPYCVRAEAT
jgi:hypothetical protein